MAADYDLRENPNPRGDGEKQPLHPRIVVKGTIRTERLIRDIVHNSSLTEGDIKSSITLLAERISHYLTEGYNVELEDIGYFSATLKARPVMNPKEIRSMSVSFDTVKFRPAVNFKKKLRQGELSRASYGFRKSSAISDEERKALLENYLEKKPFITRKEYTTLTGRLKSMAQRDLTELVKEGFLKKYGKGVTTVYARGEKKD